MQTDKDRDALLRGLKIYNRLLPNPMHVSEVGVRMLHTEYPLHGGDGYSWYVAYGPWHGYGDTIMGAANDAASKMPAVVAS